VLRAFEGLVLYWLITDRVLEPKSIVRFLLLGAVIQIGWGYAQVRLNQSLGLAFLGESVIGPEVLGVAKVEGAEALKQVRSYGSFLHPNILAAYLLTVFLLALRTLNNSNKFFWLAVFTWGVYLTQSRAALLVGAASLILYFLFTLFFRNVRLRKPILMLTLFVVAIVNFWFFQNSSLVQTRAASFRERLNQNVISQEMFQSNLWGVGVHNFTLEMENYSEPKLLPWEFQPVHNTYFLILNETGIQGLFLLLVMIFFVFYHFWHQGKGVALMALLLLAPLDHFLWDSWVGMMLVALVIGFFALENQTEKLMEQVAHAVEDLLPESDV